MTDEATASRSGAPSPVPAVQPRGASLRTFIAANQWVLLLALIVLLGAITASINPRFLDSRNLISILEQSAVLGLVAAGATMLIISGNFDISVGAMIGLAAVIMAMLVLAGIPEPLAVVVGILTCVVCSVANAGLARAFNAPTFIVTLATAGIFTGIGLALTQGIIQQVPNDFTFLSGTRLFDVMPLVFIVSLCGYLAVGLILRYTRMGRRTYAIGDNPRAAFLAGINVTRSTLFLFAINGLLIGVAAVVLISRIGSAHPSTGAGLELRAIGAVVIGGVPITGGKGGVLGTFLGVLLLGVISNMLNMLRINPFLQEIAFGGLIVVAIGIAALRSRMEPSR
ncbi:MAG: ABC transporter permease [Chloroflexi bacterium]|nr:ABC transporter permease [Chloroflexota bacterium]